MLAGSGAEGAISFARKLENKPGQLIARLAAADGVIAPVITETAMKRKGARTQRRKVED